MPDYTPDKLPFTDGQRIEHVQSLTNGQPTRVTSQASLYARDQNPVLRHLGGMVDEIKALEANAEARLDAFEARHRGDVPSETYRRTAVNAEQAKYERRAVFTNMVTRYCLAERKKGRSSLTYAQAEAECKALAGKA
ncbi:MAG TPA: hypothetical protein PK867_16520 [Pirellulales bacterium]|nr:hypothetical protein [Pirellulales bacterium]